MTVSYISVNGTSFLVLFMHDASMTQEAQEKHNIKVKALRVETYIPVLQDSIFTSDVVMVAFFSTNMFDVGGNINAPVCLLEKR